MKFQIKHLVAAVALAASAAAAHADINNAPQGTELLINIWDGSASYTRGLQLALGSAPGETLTTFDSLYNSWVAAGTGSKTWAADATLTSYLSNHTGTLSWNVLAADTQTPYRSLATYAGTTPPADFTSVELANYRSNVAGIITFINGVNNQIPGTTKRDGGSAVVLANSTPSSGYYGSTYGAKIVGTFFDTHGIFDHANASVLDVARVGDGTVANEETVYNYSGLNFTLGTDGTLTLAYTAPVVAAPEPETYAMFLAGLGLMGAIARRRRQS